MPSRSKYASSNGANNPLLVALSLFIVSQTRTNSRPSCYWFLKGDNVCSNPRAAPPAFSFMADITLFIEG